MRNGISIKCIETSWIASFVMLLACAATALPAMADTAADSIMFRKRPAVKAEAPASSENAAGTRAEAKPTDSAATASASAEASVATEASAAVAVKDEKPEAAQVSETVAEKPAVVKVEKAADAKPQTKKPGAAKQGKSAKQPDRDAIITADRTDYDRKEGVVLFDRNVHVDDTQYQMHADRLFLFLDGTNDLKRLVAIGRVAITNDDKRAYCARATFNKKLGRVVMYSSDEITAELSEEGKKGSNVKGEKITFWLDSEQVEVENPVITMPGGIGGQGSVKKLIGK